MLYSLVLSIVFLGCLSKADDVMACSDYGKKPGMNSGTNNYVISLLEGFMGISIPFPFAINQCTSHSLEPKSQSYFIHTCQSDGTLKTQEYANYTCAQGTEVGDAVVSDTQDNYDVGNLGYFECSGKNTYALINLAMTPDSGNCDSLNSIYVGLGPCMVDVQGESVFSTFCDSTTTTIQWFIEDPSQSNSNFIPSSTTNPDNNYNDTNLETTKNSHKKDSMCDASHYCYGLNIPVSESCQFIGGLQGTIFQLYGKTVECTGTSESSQLSSALSPSFSFFLWIVVAALINWSL